MRNKARSALVVMVLGTLAGCGPQLGAMLYHSGLIPEEKVKAQFKLTQNRVAVLIDDPMGALPNSSLREEVHDALARELASNKASGPIVPASELAQLERARRDFDSMSVRAIGEQLRADQVLCVTMQDFSIGQDARHGIYQGRAKAVLKVCGTARSANARLWPAGGGMGQGVEVALPMEQVEGSDAAGEYSRKLTERLAQRIAMLFYEHPAEAERVLTQGRAEGLR